MNPEFIVAEVSKSWEKSNQHNTDDLISKRFETVINTNLQRCYKLVEWKFVAVMNDDILTETIIAVFKKDMT